MSNGAGCGAAPHDIDAVRRISLAATDGHDAQKAVPEN
jgi:hypothetical protein